MKSLLTAILILIYSIGTAQTFCTYAGGSCSQGLAPPSQYAVGVVSNICNILNIPYIATYQGVLQNACASIYMGTPIISYNPNFMGYLYNNNTWAPISVMAHEAGHHLNFDATTLGTFTHPWTKELRADFVSGYVLYHMGASLSDSQSAFRVMFNYMGTNTHPDTPRRMDALKQGYYQASMGF